MLPWIQQFKLQKTATFLFGCLVVVFLFFGFVHGVSAQEAVQPAVDTLGVNAVDNTVALASTDIRIIVLRIVRVILGLLGIIALGLTLYGGFLIMTSGGNEEKIAQGKLLLRNMVIGLAIIMTSFSIVHFVIKSLSEATNPGGLAGNNAQGGAQIEAFAGSGALGSGIISRHFPRRDATNVSRNTNIMVTFEEPIAPSSLIENTNDTCFGNDGKATKECQRDANGKIVNPVYGDCFPPAGQPVQPERDCDRLKTDVVKIYKTSDKDVKPLPVVEAVGKTVYEDGENRNNYNFVFDPLADLGSDRENIGYTVALTTKIFKKDGKTQALGSDYIWKFETGTQRDNTAPKIKSVFPDSNAIVSRNVIVQIDFSEPMDPTTMSGSANELTNIIFGDKNIRGEWKTSNGYRTVEFIPADACGTNSCGDTMYCLPIRCEAGKENDPACKNTIGILARTAQLLGVGSFAADSSTGITDASSNALDGDGNGSPDGKPVMPGDFHTIRENEGIPDNAYWDFQITNTINRTPPYIETVGPTVDAENVSANAPVSIRFNKIMNSYSIEKIGLVEHPLAAELWYEPDSEREQQKTVVTINHREFGVGGKNFFYFPTVPSSVKDAYQNCIYPGRGPLPQERGGSVECSVDNDFNAVNCTPVDAESDSDTGCAQTTHADALAQKDIRACLDKMKIISQQPAVINNQGQFAR